MASYAHMMWLRAMALVAAEGGVPLEVYTRMVRNDVRETALEEAAREVESIVFENKRFAAQRVRKLKDKEEL